MSVPYIVFLQNAWSPMYAGGIWPRTSWLRALEKSRTGQRLKLMINDFDLCENTTPLIGIEPSSQIPADDDHIIRLIVERNPTRIIACGKQAEEALIRLWPLNLLCLPHPAYRVVTNDLFIRASNMINAPFIGRYALRQNRSGVELAELL